MQTFRIKRGSKFDLEIPVSDPQDQAQLADLTGYTVTSQWRRYATAESYHSFTVTVDPAGIITLSLSSVQTKALAARKYVFDIFLVAPASEPRALFDYDLTLDVRENVTEV